MSDQDLDAVVRMGGPMFRRIRQACCDISGLTPHELDRHAAAIALDAGRAKERGPLRRSVPDLLHDLNTALGG